MTEAELEILLNRTRDTRRLSAINTSKRIAKKCGRAITVYFSTKFDFYGLVWKSPNPKNESDNNEMFEFNEAKIIYETDRTSFYNYE